jgi:ubiquitin-conjugating enzyme E2 variant
MSVRWNALRDRVAVAAFAVAWTALAIRIAPELGSASGLALVLVGGLTGYVLADAIAGAVHWFADRFFAPDTPVIGALLIAPFRDHHDDALGITRHDLFDVCGNNALVTLPVVVVLASLPAPDQALGRFAIVVGASTTLALFATNLFHRWAHAPSPPRLARRLQDWGLILTPERHALHHRHDHDRAYCVTSGWLNPLLDRVGLFERLEHWLAPARRQRRRTT